jgi:hypothetical protein
VSVLFLREEIYTVANIGKLKRPMPYCGEPASTTERTLKPAGAWLLSKQKKNRG